MHKLVIADDDEWIREGIKRNVPWDKGGIEVVGTAADGKEGWELISRLRPDILLSDIRMPFLDGLQLAERVSREYPDMKVIFLTGYDDFAYAKQALQLQASDYILKYEDNEKVLEAVVRAARELDEQRQLREKEKKSRALILNQFFSDLIAGVGSDEMVEREARLLGIRFCGACFCTAVLNAEGVERFQKPNRPEDSELLLFSIKNVCAELFEGDPGEDGLVHAVHYNRRINLVFNFPDAEPEEHRRTAERMARKVSEALARFLKISVRIGIGSSGDGFKHIPVSYEEALLAVQLKEVMADRDIVFADQIRHSQTSHQAILKQMTEYLQTRYADEKLTLTEVAEQVHITPSYASTLFKKYMEVNFIDYLIGIRMEKAKDLLAHTDLKAYEVSEKVGYPNTQYFSVLFKKHAGCTPMEYRGRHR